MYNNNSKTVQVKQNRKAVEEIAWFLTFRIFNERKNLVTRYLHFSDNSKQTVKA